MAKIEWTLKPDAPQQGSSDGFWCDLGSGGYIDPLKVLSDPAQVSRLSAAMNTMISFHAALVDADLILQVDDDKSEDTELVLAPTEESLWKHHYKRACISGAKYPGTVADGAVLKQRVDPPKES